MPAAVPLVATASGEHALAATVYSKSVLRVAAQQVIQRFANTVYFPSYEIITGPHARGRYFGPDCREVTQEGVDHVMRVFMASMTRQGEPVADSDDAEAAELEAVADAACDEEVLAR